MASMGVFDDSLSDAYSHRGALKDRNVDEMSTALPPKEKTTPSTCVAKKKKSEPRTPRGK